MEVNIAMICDNNYVMPTAVAITSMIENKKNNTIINIYIMCDNLNDENTQIFKKMTSKDVNIIIKEVDSSIYIGSEKKYSNVTRSSLLKFNIATELKELDKVLYVDGDILVLDDLEPLYSQSLDEKYAIAIKDGPKPDKIPGGKKHSFYKENTYFNSGVMLLNLKKMRNDDIPQKLIDYRLNEYNYFMDQDAFNRIMNNNVGYTSVLYDFMLHLISYRNENFSLKQISEFYDIKLYENIDLLFDDIKILHYTFDKPWKYYDIPFSEKWMKYYYMSPFKEQKLMRKSFLTQLYNAKSFKLGRNIAKILKIIKF